MYNLFFCMDRNYVNLLKYVFTTFKNFHNVKDYMIHFVLYSPDNDLKFEKQVSDILYGISQDYNIKCKYFIPTEQFTELIIKYEKLLFKENEEKKNNSVFGKLANWSRFFISELFPDVEKGLYLDLDILFNKNINGIFKTDITNNIVAVSPHINVKGEKRISDYITKHKAKILESGILEKLAINISDMDTYNYNCGVMYFNFIQFKKQKILDKLMCLLEHLVNTHKFIHGGTEKIQNVLIYKYSSFSVEYNSIYKYRKTNLHKNIIIHFKGIRNLNKDSNYLDLYKKIMGNSNFVATF